MVATSPIQAAAEALEAKHNQRIHKLLFFVCRNEWENSLQSLSRHPVADLLMELVGRYPTVGQVQFVLNQVAKSLNKPVEYSMVVNLIIEVLKPVYEQLELNHLQDTRPAIAINQTDEMPTGFNPSVTVAGYLTEASPPLDSYTLVSQQLSQNPNLVRIKKLLLCASRNQWENDTTKLGQLNLRDLLVEVTQLIPSLNHLNFVLGEIVKGLSKPLEYAEIANYICLQLELLYQELPPVVPQSIPQGTAIAPTTPPVSTPSVATPTQFNPSYTPGVVPPPPAAHPTPHTLNHPDQNLEQNNPEGAPPEPAAPLPNLHTYDPFNLRQEIMRYANPLRAKLLIFSTVHYPVSFADKAWTVIRSCGLGDLIQELLDSSENCVDLERRLWNTKNKLPQPDEMEPVVSAIAKAVRRHYQFLPKPEKPVSDSAIATKANMQPAFVMPRRQDGDGTEIMDENTHFPSMAGSRPSPNSDDDTCHLFSISPQTSDDTEVEVAGDDDERTAGEPGK